MRLAERCAAFRQVSRTKTLDVYEYAGKESLVNKFQVNCAAMKPEWKWRRAGGLLVPLAAVLIAMSVMCATALAQNATSVNAPLTGKDGKPLTMGQLALKFAAHLTPPFVGSNARDAIAWLQGHDVGGQPGHFPPLSPIGGWGNPNKPATVGDLTVILVQQLKIEPKAAAGGQLTAQDYQSALVSFMGSASTGTFNAIVSTYKDWVNPSINPVGPTPSSGETTRSSPTP